MRSFLLALLVGVASLLTISGPAAASPPPPSRLGGPDLGGYCRTLGYTDVALTGATAYDWHCVAGGRQGDLSFEAACEWTYGNEHAVDRIGVFTDPHSVTCWMVQPDIVAPDFEEYCTANGHSASALLGTTAYDWHCVNYNRAGPTYFDVDVAKVCRETTFGYATLDRFVNFYDANTWQCRV
ncbi:hypothetical protein OHA21_07675 [Actinoplanes sp. NBC_00393]|uniref:hypothetical protein n=1 Tax=Actinoplanes sp. NBC_00393 TaxID=2975953 RepID=UPI002E1A6D76